MTNNFKSPLGVLTIIVGLLVAGIWPTAGHAQCSVDRWSAQTGDNAFSVGQQTPTSQNKRFVGECGFRVSVAGTATFVTDNSPGTLGLGTDGKYIVRFYAYLDQSESGPDPILLFAGASGPAMDGSDDEVQIWYNWPSQQDLSMRVYHNGGETTSQALANVGSPGSWHAIGFEWEASGNQDNVLFFVDDSFQDSLSVDTTNRTITLAHLGNVNAADNGTAVHFDDFDSRRSNRPELFQPWSVTGADSCTVTDIRALRNEVRTAGSANPSFVAGVADCTADGSVNVTDIRCVRNFVRSGTCSP